MKSFFKTFLASLLGSIIGGIILIFLFILFIAAEISSASNKEKNYIISSNSVLLLQLNHPIQERTSSALKSWGIKEILNPEPGLKEILANIKKAAADDKIKGILMEFHQVPAGLATLEAIRNELMKFRKSGKFIWAYSEQYSQAGYYLATAADKIYLYPEGGIDLKGLKAEIPFFKGTLEKLEIQPEVIRHGKFKAAVEPFILDKMSPENREQMHQLLGPIWKNYLTQVSLSRKVPADSLQIMAENLQTENAGFCVQHKLADGLLYKDQLFDLIRKKTGQGPNEKISFVKLRQYLNVPDKAHHEFSSDKIAVIYAYGNIEDQPGDNTIDPVNLCEALRKARLDPKIKAIVLRVNSPGGSALASDMIWREVDLANKVKPVIASFGDYAASGGYYIACPASRIISEPTTITGSIGVFGLLFNLEGLMKNKIGITTDTVKTARYADYGSTTRALSETERSTLQGQIEKIYDNFITKVSQGRKLRKSFVDSIGQGRVWNGFDAKKIGLVDDYGGLEKAINLAAELSHLKKYRITELPEEKDPIQKIMDQLNEQVSAKILERNLGREARYFEASKKILEWKGIQARLPYEIGF